MKRRAFFEVAAGLMGATVVPPVPVKTAERSRDWARMVESAIDRYMRQNDGRRPEVLVAGVRLRDGLVDDAIQRRRFINLMKLKSGHNAIQFVAEDNWDYPVVIHAKLRDDVVMGLSQAGFEQLVGAA